MNALTIADTARRMAADQRFKDLARQASQAGEDATALSDIRSKVETALISAMRSLCSEQLEAERGGAQMKRAPVINGLVARPLSADIALRARLITGSPFVGRTRDQWRNVIAEAALVHFREVAGAGITLDASAAHAALPTVRA